MSDRNALELTETAGIRFDHLFEANYNAIYRYCARRLGGSDAEDAAAEVFAVAWRRLEAMPDGDARTAWLFGVAHRGGGPVSKQGTTIPAVRSLEQTADPNNEDLEPADDIENLLTALDGLSRTDQELLRLSS